MVWHKSVTYLPLSLLGQIIHLREEMITWRPKVEKAVQRAPISPTSFMDFIWFVFWSQLVGRLTGNHNDQSWSSFQNSGRLGRSDDRESGTLELGELLAITMNLTEWQVLWKSWAAPPVRMRMFGSVASPEWHHQSGEKRERETERERLKLFCSTSLTYSYGFWTVRVEAVEKKSWLQCLYPSRQCQSQG